LTRAVPSALLALVLAGPLASGGAAQGVPVPVPRARVAPSGAGASDWERVGDVELAFSAPWPTELRQGYAPLFLDAHNTGAVPRGVACELSLYTWSDSRTEVSEQVVLAPGEERRIELAVPVFEAAEPPWAGVGNVGDLNVYLRAHVDGAEHVYRNSTSFQRDGLPGPAILCVGEAGDADAEAERIARDWRFHAGAEGAPSGAGAPGADVFVVVAGPGALAARPESFSSLAAVVVDADGPVPPAERLAPVLARARGGGVVAFLGAEAERAARSLEPAAAWMEERFLLEELEGVRRWRLGHGQLVVGGDAACLRSKAQLDVLRHAVEGGDPVPCRDEARWLPGRFPSIPGLERLPYRAYAIALVLFAVLIGPVNFIVLKRMGKNHLLLLTIPGIALIASVGLLAYGILYQGLEVKLAEASLAVLDQRHARATTVQARALFAGIKPGEGLEPAPGTACYPLWRSLAAPVRLEVDLTAGTRLAGDFVLVRTLAQQVLVGDRASRLRLEVAPAAGGLEARNGLDARVLELVVRAPGGGWYRSDAALEPGASAPLVPTTFAAADELLGAAERRGLLAADAGGARAEWMAEGTYFARLDASPFVDDCGVDAAELAGWHAVHGVLDASAAVWGGGRRR